MVERETWKPLKCLRSDNGGIYTSYEFRDYCSKHGIRHKKTVPGTPQHNGVAEQMNHTIIERVRCMLKSSKLPKPFWGAVVQKLNQHISIRSFEIWHYKKSVDQKRCFLLSYEGIRVQGVCARAKGIEIKAR